VREPKRGAGEGGRPCCEGHPDERVMRINDLQTLTNDVVEAARNTLVIDTN